MEAQVLKQYDITGLKCPYASLHDRANAVGKQLDWLAEKLRQAFRARRKRQIVNSRAVGAPEVRTHRNCRAVVQQITNGGHRRANPRVVGDPPGVEGCIEVSTYEHALPRPRTARRIHLDRALHYGRSLCARSTTRHE